MPRPFRPSPRELTPGWLDAVSSDPIAEVARQFASNLKNAIGDRSLRDAAMATGVDHTTILKVLAGQAWPDLYTIAKLERGLGVSLWPGIASKPSRKRPPSIPRRDQDS